MFVHLRFALAATLLTSACVGPDPRLDQALVVGAPAEVAGSLLLVDTTRQRIEVVSTEGKTAVQSHLPYSGSPNQRAVTADDARLLLLDTAARQVAVATPKALHNLALSSPFSGLQLAGDGLFAVAWHTPAASADALVNPAELAVLDLVGLGTPKAATITGLARQPLAAHISPPINLPGGAHRLVWLDATSMLGLADFGPSGVRTAVVQLTAGAAKVQVTPRASVLRVQPSGADLYVVASGIGDVLHLSIDLSGEALGVSIDQIAAGVDVVDLHVYEQKSGGLRVLTANAGSRDLALLDPTSGTGFSLALDVPPAHILPFSDGTQSYAAIWTPGYSTMTIATLDDLAKKKGKALRVVALEQPLKGVVAAGGHLLLEHDSSSAGLSLYDAASAQLTSFKGTGALVDVRVIGNAAYFLGLADGHSRLSRIDLSNLHGSSLTLDQMPSGLHALGSAGVAISGGGLGGWWIAAFPDGSLDASKATFLEGFSLTGLYGGVR